MDEVLDRLLFFCVYVLPFVLFTLAIQRGWLPLVGRANRAVCRSNAGNALLQAGRDHDALSRFDAALRLRPSLGAARVGRAAALLCLGRLDEALAEADDGVRLCPGDANALAWRAHFKLAKGMHDAALADAEAALAIWPDTAGALLCRAIVSYHRKDWDPAIADCDRIVAIEPRNGQAFALRGSLHLETGEHGRGFADLDRAVELGVKAALNNRGMALLEMGRYDETIASFEEGAAGREDALFHNNRGLARLRKGDYAGAVEDLHAAIRLDPVFPNPHKNLALLRAACPGAEYRDGREAVEFAGNALRLAGDSLKAEWYGVMAAALAESGRFEEAIEWQVRCVEGASGDARAEEEARLEGYRNGRPYRLKGGRG